VRFVNIIYNAFSGDSHGCILILLSLIKIFSSLPSVEMTGHLGTSGWSGLGGGEAATKPTPQQEFLGDLSFRPKGDHEVAAKLNL
jgi:hypothetical protein